MKRLIALLSAACVVGALGVMAADTVYSRNVAGLIRKSVAPGQRILVSMAVKNMSNNGTNTLVSIFGTNQLTQNGSYPLCDRVILWEGTKYHSYAQWTDGNFYGCNTATEWASFVVTNPVIPIGSSFWIVRADNVSTTNTISFSGEVIADSTNTVPIKVGYQMVAYPFSSAINMNSINTNGMTWNDSYPIADQIVTWESNKYQRYALWKDGIWYKCNTATEWSLFIAANRVLDVGEGVWFIGQTNFTWAETNRYLDVLQ